MMKAAALPLACSPQGFESKTSHVFPRQEFGKMENMGGMMEGLGGIDPAQAGGQSNRGILEAHDIIMAEQGGRFFETIFWNCNENYIKRIKQIVDDGK